MAIGATVRVIILSQAFGKPDVQLTDNGEQVWSFGQLLSMLILVLPFISALEITRGELKVAPPSNDSETIPLVETHHQYQPNPFFGSSTNLFKR
jgi:hypothetical protein